MKWPLQSNCSEVKDLYQFVAMCLVFLEWPVCTKGLWTTFEGRVSAAYVDNIVVFNIDWENLSKYFNKVTTELQRADLAVNPQANAIA